MSVKEQAKAIIEQMDDDATWNDVVKELYLQKKITLGMTDLEVVQHELTEADVNAIMARLESASSQPDDMRNTRSYKPGDATTLGMIAGVVAIAFALVFPPITWIAAPVAVISGVIGIKEKQDKGWVPILLAIISMGPMIPVLMQMSNL